MSTFNADTTGAKGLLPTSSTVWATARGAATSTGAAQTADTVDNPRANKTGANYEINRYFFAFDTSSLPEGSNIISASLNMHTNTVAVNGNDDTTSLHVVQASQPIPPTTLTTAEFDALTFTSGGSIALSALSNDSDFSITLNATGRGFINTSGYTKFALINSRDLDNSAPTGTNACSVCTPDHGTAANRPTLTVAFSTGAAVIFY